MIGKRLFLFVLIPLFIASGLLTTGCSTTKEPLTDRFPNLVKVSPPDRIPYVEKELSISSVELITLRKSTALLIKGEMPNTCTSILRAEMNIVPEILNIEMIGWQKYQQECAEGTKPFSYLVRNISNEEWKDIGWVYINEEQFMLDKSN